MATDPCEECDSLEGWAHAHDGVFLCKECLRKAYGEGVV